MAAEYGLTGEEVTVLDRLRQEMAPEPIADLIERSSLGTPEAKAARESVSDERAAQIVAQANRLHAAAGVAATAMDEAIGEFVTARAGGEFDAGPREAARLAVEALFLAGMLAPGADEDEADEVLLVRLPGRMSGRVTVGHSRLPAATVLHWIGGFGEGEDVRAAYPSLTGADVAVLTQLARDLADVRVPVDLDTLIGWVELALESSAIEVDVWETGLDGARTALSTHPLYRLVRCLRSAGLLDERDDGPQVP